MPRHVEGACIYHWGGATQAWGIRLRPGASHTLRLRFTAILGRAYAVSAVFSQICQKRQLLTPSEGDQRTHPARPTAPMPPVCYWVGVVYYFGWVCFLVGLKAQRHQRPTMNVVSWLSCDAVHADTTCCCSVTWLSYCI